MKGQRIDYIRVSSEDQNLDRQPLQKQNEDLRMALRYVLDNGQPFTSAIEANDLHTADFEEWAKRARVLVDAIEPPALAMTADDTTIYPTFQVKDWNSGWQDATKDSYDYARPDDRRVVAVLDNDTGMHEPSWQNGYALGYHSGLGDGRAEFTNPAATSPKERSTR